MTKLHFSSALPADWPDTQGEVAPPARWSSADQARYEELAARRDMLADAIAARVAELMPNRSLAEVHVIKQAIMDNPLAMHQLLDEFTTREV